MDQDVVNTIIKQLDDMFLRLICLGTNKNEIETFKGTALTSIIEIRKNLDKLGLKLKEGHPLEGITPNRILAGPSGRPPQAGRNHPDSGASSSKLLL